MKADLLNDPLAQHVASKKKEQVSPKSQRNQALDIAKGLGIMLVVLGHSPWVTGQESLKDLVYTMHVPLFIFLSGVFFSADGSLRAIAIRRADILLKPYFVTLLGLAAFQLMARGRDGVSLLEGIFYGTGATVAWIPLWFLTYLWLLTMVVCLCWKITDWGRSGVVFRVVCLLVLLLSGVALMRMTAASSWVVLGYEVARTGLPWGLDLVPLGAFFFLLGRWCRDSLLHMQWKPWLTLAAVVVFALVYVATGASMDLNERRYDSMVWSTLAALLGIGIALQVSVALCSTKGVSRMLRDMGQASLVILIFHAIVQARLYAFLQAHVPGAVWLHAAIALIVGIAVPMAFYRVMQAVPVLGALWLPRRRKA